LPTIGITGGNTVAASCTITSLTKSGRENLGYYFDGDYVDIKINALEVSPTGILQWQVSQGSLPPGLVIDQTGRISGFAQAPARPGDVGTAAYDVGRYDQFVYDFEGAADSRVYLLSRYGVLNLDKDESPSDRITRYRSSSNASVSKGFSQQSKHWQAETALCPEEIRAVSDDLERRLLAAGETPQDHRTRATSRRSSTKGSSDFGKLW
jgi:hypothetical protein